MIINRKNLIVAKVASTDEGRCHIHGVLLEPDGSTVATDGHRMARVTAEKSNGIPGAEAFPGHESPGAPVVIPRELAVDLARTLKSQRKTKRNVGQPSLRRAAFIKTGPGMVAFEARSMDGTTTMLEAKSTDMTFPPYEKVIPSETPTADYAHVDLDARYLVDLGKMALDFGCSSVSFAVHHQHGKPSYGEDGYTLDPIVATCKNHDTGQVLTQVLMPRRK